MKKLHLFSYGGDSINPASVIWYFVPVGISRRDVAALKFIRRVASGSPLFFFAPFSLQVSSFLDSWAASLFSSVCAPAQRVALLRRKFISVQQLASSLRRYPPSFLNSSVIYTGSIDGVRLRAGLTSEAEILRNKYILLHHSVPILTEPRKKT